MHVRQIYREYTCILIAKKKEREVCMCNIHIKTKTITLRGVVACSPSSFTYNAESSNP